MFGCIFSWQYQHQVMLPAMYVFTGPNGT